MFFLNKGSKIYISGPIRNYQFGNRAAFDNAAELLTLHGYFPINPHVLNDRMTPDRKEIYSECLRDDFKELVTCEGIYMLKNWHFSTGANLELKMALALELPVWFEQRNDCLV